MSDEALRMARAEQAEAAMKQFLGPAFDLVRWDYLQALADAASAPLDATARAKMEKLALGIKVIDRVRKQIEGAVIDGALATADAKRANQLASLSAEKRWWASW
jgi:hypothetical protein